MQPADVLPVHLAVRTEVTPEGHWLLRAAADRRSRDKTRGARQGKGYGSVTVPGTRNKRGKPKSALWHRFIRERVDGPIPPGRCVCHNDALCTRKDCGAPDHTRVDTYASNNRDGARKRAARQAG
jgi:hypothetical protein